MYCIDPSVVESSKRILARPRIQPGFELWILSWHHQSLFSFDTNIQKLVGPNWTRLSANLRKASANGELTLVYSNGLAGGGDGGSLRMSTQIGLLAGSLWTVCVYGCAPSDIPDGWILLVVLVTQSPGSRRHHLEGFKLIVLLIYLLHFVSLVFQSVC